MDTCSPPMSSPLPDFPPRRWLCATDLRSSADATTDAGGYAPALLAAPPVRVDMGDPLPPGADAVAALDVVVARRGRHEALAAVASGEGVLTAQGDVAPGTVLRRAGERLRPVDMAVLVAAGIEHVRIRAPRSSPGADAAGRRCRAGCHLRVGRGCDCDRGGDGA